MINIQPISAPDYESGGTYLWVNEIFDTIQGEGPYAGTPATFVRLAGCNIRCTFCDTDYSFQSIDSVDNIVGKCNHILVVITGGEPFRQNIHELVRSLLHAGHAVQIETNGTLSSVARDFPWNDVTIVCSPKTNKIHSDILEHCRDWKFVYAIDDHGPFPSHGTQKPNGKPPRHEGVTGTIWAQPMDDKGDRWTPDEINKHVAKTAMRYGHRLCLQLHKILDLP